MYEKETFEVTLDHIKLLRRMYVSWNDCEYGAPEINPKRPYGNSSVALDIAEILGWKVPNENLIDASEYGTTMAIIIAARTLHRGMDKVLQIFIDNFGITTGVYTKEKYSSEAWRLVVKEKGGV